MSRSIENSVTIKASPEAVFKALIDARELTKWFPTSAESDPRTGGDFKFTFLNEKSPDRDHIREGKYLEVVSNTKVRYPWHMSPGDAPTTVEFSVSGQGKETTVRLVHSGWGSGKELDGAVQMHTQGWGFFLQNLKSVLEGGKDGRAATLGMKTR